MTHGGRYIVYLYALIPNLALVLLETTSLRLRIAVKLEKITVEMGYGNGPWQA